MKIEIFVKTTLLKSRFAFYKIFEILIFEAISQPIILYIIFNIIINRKCILGQNIHRKMKKIYIIQIVNNQLKIKYFS